MAGQPPGAESPGPPPSSLLTKQSGDGAWGWECPSPARGQVRGRLPGAGEGPLPEGRPLACGSSFISCLCQRPQVETESGNY